MRLKTIFDMNKKCCLIVRKPNTKPFKPCPTNKPYITTLTPLRGIAALLVLIFHSNLMVMPFHSSNVNFMSGWLWVDFFFVLSGFIIFYVYGESFKQSITTASYWKYIKARFARVYPLHFFTLIWCLVCAIVIIHYANGLHPFFGDMLNPYGAIPSLLFIQSLGLYGAAPLNTPSWSLSTEWWVYMIFPLMVPFFTRLKNRWNDTHSAIHHRVFCLH